MLSILIVNYRSASYIIDCINSAKQFGNAQNFEWIIIDNQSNDDSKILINTAFPVVKWIDMNYNAGFARANNEGIKQSTGDIVLLLNPDTIILNDALEKCYQAFSTSNFAACGVQLLNTDSSPQISGNFFIKGGLNQLLPLPFLGNLLRRIAFAMQVKKANIPEAKSIEKVDWINGAFLMVKKAAIEKAGLMDEDFFLYAEETEWCSRLKKVGELCIYGNINIMHLQGETINNATGEKQKGYTDLFSRKGLQLMVSHSIRIRKQYGKAWFLFHLFMYSFEILVFFCCNIFFKVFIPKKSYSFKTVAGYTTNVLRLWKLSIAILKNKPHFYKML